MGANEWRMQYDGLHVDDLVNIKHHMENTKYQLVYYIKEKLKLNTQEP